MSATSGWRTSLSGERVRQFTRFAVAMVAIDCGGGGSSVQPDAAPDAGSCSTSEAPDTVRLAGACPRESLLGTFTVANRATSNQQYAAVEGKVLDRPNPAPILRGEYDDCRLLQRPNPFCNPACGEDEVCVADGVCSSTPRAQDMGTIQFRGLAQCLSLTPKVPGNNYFATDVALGIAPLGSAIELQMPAGGASATLYGVGVEDLPLAEQAWDLVQGSPLTIEWPAPASPSRSRMLVFLNIDQHGAAPVTLVCDTADDGELSISTQAVDALFEAGVSGFPNAGLVRRTMDSVSTQAGCVEFAVTSERVAKVRCDGCLEP